MSSEDYFFFLSPKLIVGKGFFKRLAREVFKFGLHKVMVLTDKGIMATGNIAELVEDLEKESIQVEIFDEVKENPDVVSIDGVGKLVERSRPDGLIAVGGGSTIDTAKGAAIVASCGGSIKDYFGEDKVKQRKQKLFVVPTTAGTGSEATMTAAVDNPETHKKNPVRSAYCMPDLSILDPSLLVSLPEKIAAETGIDALSHAIEAYVSTEGFTIDGLETAGPWLITEALSLKAVSLISENIRRFVSDRSNIVAGGKMLVASCMAGMCITHARTGITHGIARNVAPRYGFSHGLSIGLLLPHTIKHGSKANTQKYARIARAMDNGLRDISDAEAASRVSLLVGKLISDLGMTHKMKDCGVVYDDLKVIARETMGANEVLMNPGPTTFDDILGILHKAY